MLSQEPAERSVSMAMYEIAALTSLAVSDCSLALSEISAIASEVLPTPVVMRSKA